MDGVPEGL